MSRVTPESWHWRSRDEKLDVWRGRHQDLGCTWGPEASNFAVWAPEATAVWVCLFDEDDRETRYLLTEQTLGVWNGQVPGVRIGQGYGFRADGPWDPRRGRRFDPAKLLLDPYARAITGEPTWGPELLDHEGDPMTRSTLDSAAVRCRAAWSCTTSSTGATTSRSDAAGATP